LPKACQGILLELKPSYFEIEVEDDVKHFVYRATLDIAKTHQGGKDD
jgi:hypothetical protein